MAPLDMAKSSASEIRSGRHLPALRHWAPALAPHPARPKDRSQLREALAAGQLPGPLTQDAGGRKRGPMVASRLPADPREPGSRAMRNARLGANSRPSLPPARRDILPAPSPDPAPEEPEVEEPAESRPAQRQAAGEAWRAGVALLEAGAGAADGVVEGELLRAAHSCRVASLPRVASAAAREAERVRQMRARAAEYRLDALAADLFDLLATARALPAAGPVEAGWVGRARGARRPVARCG